MEKFKQAIRIGDNVTDIMKLPCVFSCHKMGDGGLEYLLYDWDENAQYVKVHKGDWLCQGYDGSWHKLSDKEHERTRETGT